LDGFKAINDNYGHEIGDKVLVNVAGRLSDSVRESDIVARMGGDEFTLILRNVKNTDAVEVTARKIYFSLKQIMHIKEHECQVGSSIGIAVYPQNGKDMDTLLRNADAAMYAVKKNGKGGYQICTEASCRTEFL